MTKAKPKTGEARVTKQPLKIDRLPPYVHDAILVLRNQQGKTWEEISALSAEPFGDGKSGFIEWEALPLDVLELFPDMRLPHSSLHRWHDLRVTQVHAQVKQQVVRAQEIARFYAGSVVKGDDAAVMNAARDTLMAVLSEDTSTKGRQNAAKALISLGDLQQKARANKIKERKVTVDEKALQAKLDEIKRKAEALIRTVEGGGDGTVQPMSQTELVAALKGVYGVA